MKQPVIVKSNNDLETLLQLLVSNNRVVEARNIFA